MPFASAAEAVKNRNYDLSFTKVGKRHAVSRECVWRWHRDGVRRGDRVVRLFAIRLGYTLRTSEEDLAEFVAALNDGPDANALPHRSPPPGRPPALGAREEARLASEEADVQKALTKKPRTKG